MQFVRDMTFEYAAAEPVAPGIRRVVARNPGAFTFHGTGTYILGEGRIAVVDPGPDLPEHVDALLACLKDERITDIVVTHTHLDHSPAARPLKAATGATVHGFGPHGAGRGGALETRVEEGADMAFVPDQCVRDGDVIAGPGWTLEAIHTPGHTSNHLCFALREADALFSGDHVMGWSTTVVVPPDGDMAAYMTSLDRLLARREGTLWPTHGPPVRDPAAHIAALIDHRHARERQILSALAIGPSTIPHLVATIYDDVPKYLHAAAGCSVLAHIIALVERGAVTCDGPPTLEAVYERR
ncbi:MAG: MBL fold metallo-hydrolase [Alphaproteobacteria bacterium]|nr:MBL fold metallo-hydrolase [Alphaproteobacteria bacterium]